jgi:hypothetical protein
VGPRADLQTMGNRIPLSLPGIKSRFRQLVAEFLPRRSWFEPRSGHVGFVAYKVASGQVFSKYFSFPCQFSFCRLLHTHLSSRTGTIEQIVASPPKKLKN